MRECIAICHLEFEDLGTFEDILLHAGYRVRYIEAPRAAAADIENAEPDLLVVLGGPVSANDEADYPFLASELRLLERRLEHNLPTLGICLGAQLMARALGARVAPAVRGEVGWLPLTLTASGSESVLRHFTGAPVFHWHGDAFDLPEHGVPLASTPDCPHQAFSVGANLLGVQFHPEVTPEGLESWYVGHYRALRNPSSPPLRDLRADAARHGETLQHNAAHFFNEWLAGLEHA